jgi:hypothetical protein
MYINIVNIVYDIITFNTSPVQFVVCLFRLFFSDSLAGVCFITLIYHHEKRKRIFELEERPSVLYGPDKWQR